MAKTTRKGFLTTVEQYKEIMGKLLRKQYSGLYFLCGDEPFFVDKISNYIAENVLDEGEQSFNQFLMYGSETPFSEFADACRQYPMGSKYTVVILKEAHSMRGLENFIHYATSPLSSSIVVICYSGVLNKTQKLYKAISKNGVYFESLIARDYEIQEWLMNYIRSKGYTTDSVSVSLLVESLGTSITKIENELTKLINSLPLDKKTITSDDIERNIGISKDFNNFELTKALSEFNIVKALRIADYFANNPQRNSFASTIVAVFNHFSRIFKLGLILWEAKTQNLATPSDSELALKLQIGSSFFLKEYYQALKYYPLKKLFIIFGIIREYEMKGKGVEAGSAETGDLLKEMICKITSL